MIMSTICGNCEWIIKGYNNTYGTYCPKCGSFIKPEQEPDFVSRRKKELKKLQKEFLSKFKNKFKNIKD